MSTKGFTPIPVGAEASLSAGIKRRQARRTGQVLLAGACLGAVLVCAVLMPLVYTTLADLQEKVDQLSDQNVQKVSRSGSAADDEGSAHFSAQDTVADSENTNEGRRRRDAPEPRRPVAPRSGAVYVRWGRDSCADDIETVYSGVVGAGHYSHHGGSGNYQCLPMEDIEWNKPQAGNQHHSYIYGAEYELNSAAYFSTDNMDSITNPFEYDVPCSVCHVAGRSAHVMIPARLSCPQGWSKEYSGYLMSSHHSHNSNTDFLCVDEAPNLRPGSAANLNGALLYLVEAQCGSLPNGPYIQGYELTCVVCTK